MNNLPKNALHPIHETPSLEDLAYRAIKSSILSLALPPGTQLTETVLANSLKVSKTPVREALKRLEVEGLVRIVPRKGVFVTEVFADEIEEITEIRSVLVGLAARKATGNAAPADIEEARQILKTGDQALEQRDHEQWLQINDKFHSWLIDLAQNRSLKQVLRPLDEYFQRIQGIAANVPGEIIESNIEHYKILEAIDSGDPDAAAQSATSHIHRLGKQATTKYLETIRQTSD